MNLKRIYFFSFFFLFFIFSARSQFGIKAGIGVSDIVFSNEGQSPFLGYETEYLTHRYPLVTFQGGFDYLVSINKHFEFQPELLFVKQGLNYSMEFIYDQIVNRINVYYIQVPTLLRYRFALTKKHQPNVYIGPYLALNVISQRIKGYNGITSNMKVENIKPIDFGLITGFGYDFDMNAGLILTGFRIGYGLINMMETLEGSIPRYSTPSNLKARNMSVTLMISYRFKGSQNNHKRS